MASTDRRRAVHVPFPHVRVVDRELSVADTGPLFVWDIDRTYLDTRISQLRGLAWIPFEFGIDKRALAGSIELLRALRAGPSGHDHRPLWFATASPPQLAGALERKMLLDGVEWDGITYKDQARLFVRREFDQLRNQTAFKLTALLQLLAALPPGLGMHVFGDDVESDPLIFTAFADLAAGRLRGDLLARFLASRGVRDRYVKPLVELAADFPARDVVQGIHIRLDRGPDGSTLQAFDSHVVGYPTWAAAAVRLRDLGLVSPAECARVEAASPPSVPFVGPAVLSGGFLTPGLDAL